MAYNQIKVELLDSWGTPKNVAHQAWASSHDKEKLDLRTPEDVKRICKQVVELHHDTPKERLWFDFYITAPIFVERQFDKYRMSIQYQDFQITWLEAPMGRDHITQNELSGRYRTVPERAYSLPEDIRAIYLKAEGEFPPDLKKTYIDAQLKTLDNIVLAQHETYKRELEWLKKAQDEKRITNAEFKRCREVLRGILGTSYLTDMRLVMNLNAFEHIINQRLAPEAQLESRIVAYLMVKTVRERQIAPELIEPMVVANGWDKWLSELDNLNLFE